MPIELALTIPDKAKSLAVTSQADLDSANEFLKSIKGLRKEVDKAFDPIIKSAHQAHRQAIEQKKKYELPLAEGEQITKKLISGYVVEMEKMKAEAEANVKQIQANLMTKQMEAMFAGEKPPEGSVLDMPKPVETPVMADGVSVRKIWKWRLTDSTKIPREYLMVDEAKIGKTVREWGEHTEIPGVEVFEETVIGAKGG